MKPRVPDTSAKEHRFLIVDSDALVGRALHRSLERTVAAVWVTTVASARDALDRRKWTGMIIDVALPDGSGLHLIRERQITLSRVPTLVITAGSNPGISNACYALRASYVSKPDILSSVTLFVERTIALHGDRHVKTMAAVAELASAVGLSQRQAQLVELVSLGVPREGLASELQISENTLKTLVRRTLEKCGESRVEGVARAVLERVILRSCDAETT